MAQQLTPKGHASQAGVLWCAAVASTVSVACSIRYATQKHQLQGYFLQCQRVKKVVLGILTKVSTC